MPTKTGKPRGQTRVELRIERRIESDTRDELRGNHVGHTAARSITAGAGSDFMLSIKLWSDRYNGERVNANEMG